MSKYYCNPLNLPYKYNFQQPNMLPWYTVRENVALPLRVFDLKGPEWESRVENRCSLPPPSALKPMATAMASRIVDFPVPFSPTKIVTGLENAILPSRISCRTAGMPFRYESGFGGSRSRIARR